MPIQKKVCLLGDFAVGKTSLVSRFVEGRFDDKYLSTIGVKISRKVVQRGDSERVNLLLWDLAGGDDFSKSGASYLRGAAGALIVCDLTRAETLRAVSYYSQQIGTISETAALVIVGNKVDLTTECEISDYDMAALAADLNAPYLLVSAKTGQCVEEAFQLLTDRMDL